MKRPDEDWTYVLYCIGTTFIFSAVAGVFVVVLVGTILGEDWVSPHPGAIIIGCGVVGVGAEDMGYQVGTGKTKL